MLTENYDAQRQDGILIKYPVAAGQSVYKGALVCLDEDGLLVDGHDYSGYTFVGISYEKADNAKGKDGEATARVWKIGTYVYNTDFEAKQEHVGLPVYVVNDDTVSVTTNFMVA